MLLKSSAVLDDVRAGLVPNPDFLDLEILYIGQTKRTSMSPVIDRLISHSTLQKIYSEKRPDKDIYLLLANFVNDGTVELSGSVRTQKKYEKEDINRLKGFIQNKLQLTDEQRILISEAALIRYFDPHYNENHKKTFPKKQNKSYQECYNLDLNQVSVEINTDFYFYSKKIKTNNRHKKKFSLTDDVERRKIFDYTIGFDIPIKKSINKKKTNL